MTTSSGDRLAWRVAGRLLDRISGWACALLSVLAPAGLGAAPPARFTRLSVEQGLSQSTVQAMLQDHVGFLWFGTEEGLDRYDGYTFVVFRHDPQDPQSLPDDRVSTLYEDRQHRLWVGTQGGLSLFDFRTRTFAPVPSIRARVGAIAEAEGTLWVGTEEGLFVRDSVTGLFKERSLEGSGGGLGHAVSSLLADRSGRLWIATRDGGVDLLERTSKRIVHHRHDPRDPRSLTHDDVWGLAEDAAGRLWVATYGGGLNVLDHTSGAFRHYRHRPNDPASLGSDLLTCVLVDKSGTLWVGTDGAGVQRYDANSERFVSLPHDPSDPSSLSENVVRALYEDIQGHLWIGTYLGGANLLRNARSAFGYFTHSATDPTSLTDPSVASFLEDTQGRLWVGTESGWLNRFDRETGGFTHYRFPSAEPGGSALLSLHQDRRGRIWVGSYLRGLGRFDPERGSFAVYGHRPGDTASISAEIWAIAEDEQGALWLATDTGLDRFDPEQGAVTAHFDTPSAEGLSYADARALLFDHEGNLWVGTLGGLHVLSRGGGVRYQLGDRELAHRGVMALHEDHHGRIWVGTLGGGVKRLELATGAFSSYAGFPSNVIHSIQEDSSGRLWLSTNHGLSRFDPTTARVENFDLSNGLQSLQFHPCAGLRTRGGRMLFGSVDGFYDFDPAAIAPDTDAPPVVLTSMRLYKHPIERPTPLFTLEEITLSHGDRLLSLEFAALDYNLPRRNQYAYFMEGFSDQWVQLGSKRDVTFTNLDPGTYVFRVKASNSDGVWNESSAAALRVIVRPPFWGTWWFRGLLALMVGSALLGFHRTRVRHRAADLTERKRIEMALHQAEERYRSIFETAAEGIFQVTPRGRFLSVNPALARMLGYTSPEEMLTRVTAIDRRLHANPEQLREMLRLIGEEGAIHGFECELHRQDGSTLRASVNVRVVRDGAGDVLHFEGTGSDISDRASAGTERQR